jgi:TPR repeat protein
MLIVKRANEGNIPAIFKLGHLLETGNNDLVDRDISKAKELYTKGVDLLKDNPIHPDYTDHYHKFIKCRENIEAKEIEMDHLLNKLKKVDNLLNKLQKEFDRNDISDIYVLAIGYMQGHWGKKDLVKAKEIYTKGARLIENMLDYKEDYSIFLKRIDNLNILISNSLNRPNVFD